MEGPETADVSQGCRNSKTPMDWSPSKGHLREILGRDPSHNVSLPHSVRTPSRNFPPKVPTVGLGLGSPCVCS